VGSPPGPVTDELIDEAVAAGLAETDDLDWKSELATWSAIAPPVLGLGVYPWASRAGAPS
jgi:hypothetical protein